MALQHTGAQCRNLIGMLLGAFAAVSAADPAPPVEAGCTNTASLQCYFGFVPSGQSGRLHYYASQAPATTASVSKPDSALVVLHGHPRDANTTFDAALQAVLNTQPNRVLVVAPVFQVPREQAAHCHTAGVPEPEVGDLLWTCASWMEGAPSSRGPHGEAGITSFRALDALVMELIRRWPTLHTVTIAGFSAGAQMVQHYAGFSNIVETRTLHLRFVIADPGTWLYFDPLVIPLPSAGKQRCVALNRWKYGIQALPAYLGRAAESARAHYAEAEIEYLEGEHDDRSGPGTADRLLDHSCAAQAQGPYRLQRGLAYAAYDRENLAPARHRRVTVIPGCTHDVRCIFGAPEAQAALLGLHLPR